MVQCTPGGDKGNFVLVVANRNREDRSKHGLVQYVRDNSQNPGVWSGPHMLYPGEWDGVSIFEDNRNVFFQFAAVQSTGVDDGQLWWFRNQALYPPAMEKSAERPSPQPVIIQGNNCQGTPAIVDTEDSFVLELVVPGVGQSDMQHFTWNNTEWVKTAAFGHSEAVLGVSMIKSFFHHLELVAVQWTNSGLGDLIHYFYNFDTKQWQKTALIGTNFQGNPALIQSDIGRNGNFEVVAARRGGGLTHFGRNNDAPPFPWNQPDNFGGKEGGKEIDYKAVSLIESNVNARGELYVAAVRSDNDTVDIYKRSPGPQYTWSGPTNIG